MTGNIFLAALLLAVSNFSGCFNFSIEEKTYLRADGSGNYRYSIDATETMLPLLEMMRGLEEITRTFNEDSTGEPQAEKDFMDEIITDFKKDFDFTETGMHKVKGISNYGEFIDTAGGKFIMGFAYDFNSVESLNNSLTAFYKSLEEKGENPSELIFPEYTYSDSVFSRHFKSTNKEALYDTADIMDGSLDATLYNLGDEYMDFTYTVIYEFEREVAEVNAPEAGMLKEPRRVTLNYDTEAILHSLLQSEVRLK